MQQHKNDEVLSQFINQVEWKWFSESAGFMIINSRDFSVAWRRREKIFYINHHKLLINIIIHQLFSPHSWSLSFHNFFLYFCLKKKLRKQHSIIIDAAILPSTLKKCTFSLELICIWIWNIKEKNARMLRHKNTWYKMKSIDGCLWEFSW